jgi:mono/diheme cytochrome c family protein
MVVALSTNDIAIGLAALVLVVFSLTVALVVPRRRPDFPGSKRGVAILALVAAGLVAATLATVETLGEGHHFEAEAAAAEGGEPAPPEPPAEPSPPPAEPPAEPSPPPPPAEPPAAPAGDPAAGKEVFASAGCAACHTLADAGATGTIGPDLDQSQPAFELVVDRVTNGRGAMPPFAGTLSETQIQDVAAYVVSATGG